MNSKLQFNILDDMATPYPRFSIEYNSWYKNGQACSGKQATVAVVHLSSSC